MSNALLIGVTGGIGSGKSTVCKIFSVLGIPIYDADSRAKALMMSDNDLKDSIIQEFGKESYVNDQLNRDYLTKAFENQSRLTALNNLVHPAVGKDFLEWSELYSEKAYIIKEAALLFETESYKQLDHVILVRSSEVLKKQRIMQRDQHRTIEEIDSIMQRQWTDEKKKNLSQFIIENDESRMLIPQVLTIHRNLMRLTD